MWVFRRDSEVKDIWSRKSILWLKLWIPSQERERYGVRLHAYVHRMSHSTCRLCGV